MPKHLTPEKLEALKAMPLNGLSNRLKIALALADVRQIDVVDETGLSAPSISNIVNGKYSELDIEVARQLANYFGCDIEDLFPKRAA